MEIFDKIYEYHRHNLRRRFPRTRDERIDKAAYKMAKEELANYDAQEDFERLWNQAFRAAA